MNLTLDDRIKLERLLWHCQLIIANERATVPAEWKGCVPREPVDSDQATEDCQKWRRALLPPQFSTVEGGPAIVGVDVSIDRAAFESCAPDPATVKAAYDKATKDAGAEFTRQYFSDAKGEGVAGIIDDGSFAAPLPKKAYERLRKELAALPPAPWYWTEIRGRGYEFKELRSAVQGNPGWDDDCKVMSILGLCPRGGTGDNHTINMTPELGSLIVRLPELLTELLKDYDRLVHEVSDLQVELNRRP